MEPYSIHLREKIVGSVRRGISESETARRFGVNRSTVKRYLEQLDGERAPLVPRKAPGSPPKPDESAVRLLEEDIEARPRATHGQGCESLYVARGVEVSEATVCRTIKRRRLGNGRKKDRQES